MPITIILAHNGEGDEDHHSTKEVSATNNDGLNGYQGSSDISGLVFIGVVALVFFVAIGVLVIYNLRGSKHKD